MGWYSGVAYLVTFGMTIFYSFGYIVMWTIIWYRYLKKHLSWVNIKWYTFFIKNFFYASLSGILSAFMNIIFYCVAIEDSIWLHHQSILYLSLFISNIVILLIFYSLSFWWLLNSYKKYLPKGLNDEREYISYDEIVYDSLNSWLVIDQWKSLKIIILPTIVNSLIFFGYFLIIIIWHQR